MACPCRVVLTIFALIVALFFAEKATEKLSKENSKIKEFLDRHLMWKYMGGIIIVALHIDIFLRFGYIQSAMSAMKNGLTYTSMMWRLSTAT